MSVEPLRWPDSVTWSAPRSATALALKARAMPVVVEERQVAGQRLDLHLGAERQRARAERAVHAHVGVQDRLDRLAAHVGLDAHLGGDHVHLAAAVGDDRVDADRVLVAERLAHGVDGREADLGGVERVDPQVRRAARVGRAADDSARS